VLPNEDVPCVVCVRYMPLKTRCVNFRDVASCSFFGRVEPGREAGSQAAIVHDFRQSPVPRWPNHDHVCVSVCRCLCLLVCMCVCQARAMVPVLCHGTRAIDMVTNLIDGGVGSMQHGITFANSKMTKFHVCAFD
jgi:hypothetical protein